MDGSRMRDRAETKTASLLSGFFKRISIFEAEGSNFFFKFIGWASFVEDIVFLTAVGTTFSRCRTKIAVMARDTTKRTAGIGSAVFVWMAKAPTFATLAGGRNILADRAGDTANVYIVWKFMSFKRNLCNVSCVCRAITRSY